jgi:glucosylceramidase
MMKRFTFAVLVVLAVQIFVSSADATTTVKVVQTNASLSQGLTSLPGLSFVPAGNTAGVKVPTIAVNGSMRYQRFAGLGAALSDSSACLIAQLPLSMQQSLIQELFTLRGGGIALNFLRLPMGASDFTCNRSPYTYDDMPPGQSDDAALSHFSIGHDMAYIIPVLKRILVVKPGLRILANPWTAPNWMKSNHSWDNLGGKGLLLPGMGSPLATYFTKFVLAYRAFGIRIWAVTPENEPGGGGSYPGMDFAEPDEADFINHYLWQAMSPLKVRIYGFDNSWGGAAYGQSLSADVGSKQAGIAWHCYSGSPTTMSVLHLGVLRNQDQIVSECSPELRPFSTAEFVIASLRNWASTVTVWNVALDPSGQPVQPPNPSCNGCTGVAVVNPPTRQVAFRAKFYQMGQFSRFIHPGAWRVYSGQNFVSYDAFPHIAGSLDDVAFVNTDGSKVLVAYNNAGYAVRFKVLWRGQALLYTIGPRTTTSFIWK